MPANTLDQVRAVLMEKGVDYLLLTALPARCAQVQFIGRFDGQEVLWNMHLCTLERYTQVQGVLPVAFNANLRGLMNIAPGMKHEYQLEVALNVPMIEEPTIQKTILMLRNYRKLRLGLHTWGDATELGE